MWGANILVCPVLQKSLTQRKLYLPEGTWYHFFTDKKEEGHQWITEYVDLENIPVFVKEGSFIPTFTSDRAIQNTGDYTGKNITVKYYPSAKASRYVLFDDDGKTNNTLAKGKYDLLILEGKQSGKNIHIILAEGKHPGMTRNIKLVLPAGYDIQSTKVNNRSYAQKDALNLTFNGKPLLIDILLK